MADITLQAAHPQPRTRDQTILARLLTATAVAAPKVGRWLRRAGSRARQLALYTSGLGCITAAAWTLALPLGLATAGVSLLVLEWLTTPEASP